ncbi:IclR family transcriptional regulator [Halohasta litorea]|uniref:IclR family transcriptional regulator n=1 Tax=Halohasta litorea TaxID=869891 RepID=A0ABD6DGL5_9EURY|nr:IclR family transcriptional regulator [Halohasta litorea]
MNMKEEADGGKRVGAVERTFRIIDQLRKSGTMRIKEIATELEMPMSTVHVHLKTLENLGYINKCDDGFRLSLRFLRDGSVLRDDRNVYTVAKSEIGDLADTTGEVANLGVEEDGKRVILYQVEGNEAVYDNALIGEFTNMHWTALGKAILAELPESEVEEIVDRHDLPSATSETIVEPEALSIELSKIRDQGYALEDEERRIGIRSIAVPINVEGKVVGAVSLSGPKERFSDKRIEVDLLPELRDCVNVIEVKVAYD